MKKSGEIRKKLGVVGVEGGTIIIGDFLCEIKENINKKDLEEILEFKWRHGRQFGYDGVAADAVICETGYGDGGYDVIATIDKKSNRVKKVEIIFIGGNRERDIILGLVLDGEVPGAANLVGDNG